ncbi:MAG: HEAT repeat domain-containing protein [Polyangiales bacterium]
MATSKKGSSSKVSRRAELVPIDDAAVRALFDRAVAAVGDETFTGAFSTWFSARERELARSYLWLQRWLNETLGASRAVPFVIESLALLDEQRVLQALGALTTALVGDHRNWLAPARFDPDVYVRNDSERAARRRALIESLEALIALTKDRSERVRAGAAFALAWLGEPARERVVPALRALLEDREPAARAAAVVALAMHRDGAGVASLMDDEDPRVRLCAAIAESLEVSSERGRATLESALTSDEVAWPDLLFNDGALSRWAILRYGAACRGEPERLKTRLVAALSDPVRASFVDAIVLASSAGWTPDQPFTAAQRAVVAVLVERPALQNAAIDPLRRAGLITYADYVTTDVIIDGLRARLGIARPPPAFGSQAKVTVRGRTDYAQHVWAEYATSPEPEFALEIAAEIASAIALDDVVDLLMRRAQDIDGSTLPYSRVASVAFEVALPEGVERRGERLVRRPEEWHLAHRDWCREREREGWLQLTSWWSGEEVITRWFDLGARSLEVSFGHDWNAGNPIFTEARALVSARHRLTPLVARAARARDRAAFDRALESFIEKSPANNWNTMRAMSVAIELFAGTGEAPGVLFDRYAILAQRSWTYVVATLLPYARLLPAERREELAVACAAQSDFALPLLYELAPIERVLEALTPALRRAVTNWSDYASRERRRWVRALGEEGAARIAEACGPAPAPETKRRSRRG